MADAQRTHFARIEEGIDPSERAYSEHLMDEVRAVSKVRDGRWKPGDETIDLGVVTDVLLRRLDRLQDLVEAVLQRSL